MNHAFPNSDGTEGTTRKRWADVCLALGATENFLPGALVAVSSFLRHHPGFGGGIVLFHDGLPAEQCAALERALPPLRFEPVNHALKERLAKLASARRALRAKLPDFYSLEAFRLDGYRKVFYCDCDLLFHQPVDELFGREEVLLCCGDQEFFNGRCHDAATYRPIDDPSEAGPGGALDRTFSCGLLLIDGQLTGSRAYAELLSLVTPETWRGTETVHSDQFMLNRHFAGRQTLVSSIYNYRLHMAQAINAREGLTVKDAKILHFTGPVKPWMPEAMLRWAAGNPKFRPHPAFSLWYEEWMQCLQATHLRAVALRSLQEGRSAA